MSGLDWYLHALSQEVETTTLLIRATREMRDAQKLRKRTRTSDADYMTLLQKEVEAEGLVDVLLKRLEEQKDEE